MAMNRRTYPRLVLALLAVGFVSFMALDNLLFGGLRVDLTENRMHTAPPGPRETTEA